MTYFFIGGCPRSGTTLLQSILCSDETTNPLIGEVGYLYHLVEAYHATQIDFESQGQYLFKDITELQHYSQTTVKNFLNHLEKHYQSAQHLVLKHPVLSQLFPSLHELIPEAKFIIMIRDPRDAIASLIQVGERMIKQGHRRHFTPMFAYRNLDEYLKFYTSAYAPSWNCPSESFQQQTLYIKYEYLVQKPTLAIQKLEKFTGLSLTQSPTDTPWKRNLVHHSELSDAAQPFYSPLYGQPISSSRIHHYSEILTPAEIQYIEQTGADILQQFGYR